MRATHSLPLTAAILLGACGGGETEREDGLTEREVVAEVDDMVRLRPGQYRTTRELLEFTLPGVTDAARTQMQREFAGAQGGPETFCLSAADAARNGPRQMVANLAEMNCEIETLDVSGNKVRAQLRCAAQAGGSSAVQVEGRMAAESSTMTMVMTQALPGAGAFNMTMRVNSQRVGDC